MNTHTIRLENTDARITLDADGKATVVLVPPKKTVWIVPVVKAVEPRQRRNWDTLGDAIRADLAHHSSFLSWWRQHVG